MQEASALDPTPRQFSSAVAVFIAALACPAIAQTPAPATVLTEVMVTATKRESTVQNTPVSVTAVSGLDIEERGLTNLTGLVQSVPGLSMRTSGPGQTEFEMRGMASTGGNSPTVGFYLGDTPLTAPATTNNGKVVIDPNLYDLNRIEVLRGPQGTLYGSGSMGGTIKLVQNPPNPENFDASAEAVLGSTEGGGFNNRENVMLNIPFGSGTAALRIVGSESEDSGWIDRVVITEEDFPQLTDGGTQRGDVEAAPVAVRHKDANNANLTAARVSLLWRPTDRLEITPSYLYQRIKQDGLSQIDSNPGTDVHYEPFDVAEPFSDDFDLGSLNFRYNFAAFELASTTSRWTRSEHLNQDATEQWQWALGVPSVYASQDGIGPIVPNLENDKSEQNSEEVRLTSIGTSALQWLVGYFYGDFESSWNVEIIGPEGVPLFGIENLYTQVVPTKIKQQAVFADLSYELTSRLKATAGLRRYTYDNSTKTTVSGAVSPTGSDDVAVFSTSENDKGLNPKFGLSFAASENLLVYAAIARGFRPGGGTGPIPTSGALGDFCEENLQALFGTTDFVPSPESYGADHVWNYELGGKMRALDDRLTINGAVYFEKWSGVQQNIPLACGYQFTTDAGDAEVKGSEVEMQAVLAPGLIFSANVGYTNAELVTSNVQGVGIEPGTPVQQVPDWTWSASLAYQRSVSDQLEFTSRLEHAYVGTRTDSTFTINQVPSYDLTSFRAGVNGNRWSAVLFVSNIFNERAKLNNVTQLSINNPIYDRVAVNQPRTFGIDLNYRFGGNGP